MLVVLFAAYLIAQVYAAIRLPGGWRWAALMPAVPMVLLMALTINAIARDSNLWGLIPMLACPPALVFVAGVLVVHRFVGLRVWAKWAFVVFTILLGLQFVRYMSATIDEQRGHGQGATVYSLAPESAVWGVPLIFMVVSTIGLWWSERRRQVTGPAIVPAGVS